MHARLREVHNSIITVIAVNMLRAYQLETVTKCDAAWARGARNVIPSLATGLGKTEIMSFMARRHYDEGGYGVAMAHRSVLVGQLSMALAKAGVPHDIIAQKKIVKVIVAKQMKKFGRSFYVPGGRWKVASVDTLPGRADSLMDWIKRVTLGFTDESHHVLFTNKWGRECNRFTNPLMRWLLPTATPERADGQGLGREQGAGIADELVVGPDMAWGIANGYLTPFQLKAPLPADLDLSGVTIGANGEYNMTQLRAALHKSKKILGSIVDTYIKHTMGMLGIAFAVDIEHAIALTKEFNDKGVRAELITGDDEEDVRDKALERYAARQTLVLVNVDLFGEGFDLPALEVVMMGRPTASYPLYAQQWGRGGRLGIDQSYIDTWEQYAVAQRHTIIATSAKPCYYVHDHVGNVIHFGGPPTKEREFSLTSRVRSNGPSDAIPCRVCLNPICLQVFERYHTHCPFCGFNVPPPPITTLPEQVDGDIILYTPEMLQRLFGVSTPAAALALQPPRYAVIPPNMPSLDAVRKRQANHNEMIIKQRELASLMPLTMPPVYTERENWRRFYHHYGMDVVAAKLLTAGETQALIDRIKNSLTNR